LGSSMGRPSKLTPAQWDELKDRFTKGEKPADLAREFKVSRATISERFSKSVGNIKTVANQIVEAEVALKSLTVSEQISAVGLANDLIAMSNHLAGAGKFGAATAHRLAGIAHGKVLEIDDANPLDEKSRDALKDVAVLTEMANKASMIPVNLLAANKETVKKLNEGEAMNKDQLLREIAAALPD
jgi:hypothetical protein